MLANIKNFRLVKTAVSVAVWHDVDNDAVRYQKENKLLKKWKLEHLNIEEEYPVVKL